MHPRKTRLAAALIGTAIATLAAGAVHAQTTPAPAAPTAPPAAAAPASPFSFNVSVASQYIYRGLTQTDYKPAIQGGVDYAHPSGFYAGTWASNVSWLDDYGISSGKVEIDLYTGFKKSFGDWTGDVGFLRYEYLGSTHQGFTNPDTNELYAAIGWKFVTLKYSHAISNTFGTADSKNSNYIDLTAAIPVADTWTLTAHAGYQKFRGPSSDVASYADWKLEIAKDFGNGFTAGLGGTGNDANHEYYTPPGMRSSAKDTVYVFAKYTF
jgi:uncharacterized protein (TIGR02001 family)